MTESEVRTLVAEVLCLRNVPAYAAEEEHLIATGAVLNSQVGRAEIRADAAHLRSLTPEPLLLQTDLETGSYFAADGTEMPPQMALGAADDDELAYDWGRAIGLEGRRLGVDVTWSPVLDVNTNPDNPIVNVRAFGEDAAQVGRLGAAVTRGMIAAGMHPCGKHWPGHGDVAEDSHISLPTVTASREHLERVDWPPYAACRAAGLDSVMTGHLLVPALDPDHCGTVSHVLIAETLRKRFGYEGVIFTDSLGMEGLRLTLDSAEAAWRAIAAGHDQVLIDYKRPPGDTVEAVVAACLDGRVPEARLRDAARRVRELKARRQNLPLLPSDEDIRAVLHDVGHRVAQASVTLSGSLPPGGLDLGADPLLVIFDDPDRYGKGLADEHEGHELQGAHPLATILRRHLPCATLVCPEDPTADDLEHLHSRLAQASAVIGATFAHITSYKGVGVRLPAAQVEFWGRVAELGMLRGIMLFESPYALGDLPDDVPVIIGYGGDEFTLGASVKALLGQRSCPGRLPVTVSRR